MISPDTFNGLIGKLVRVDYTGRNGPAKHIGVVQNVSPKRIRLELPRHQRFCSIRLNEITSVVKLYDGIQVHYFTGRRGSALESQEEVRK